MSIKQLRSSFELIKSRFQKLADDGSVGKAWLVHQNWVFDKQKQYEQKRQDFLRFADGYENVVEVGGVCFGVNSDCWGKSTGEYRASRHAKVVGWQVVQTVSKDASTLMKELPDAIKNRLWNRIGECQRPQDEMGFYWVASAFELAFHEISGSPLRSLRRYPLGDEMEIIASDKNEISFELSSHLWVSDSCPLGPVCDKAIFEEMTPFDAELLGLNPSRRINVPELEVDRARLNRLYKKKKPFDWYATFDNFAAASVLAVDVLLNWLDELEADPQPAAVVTVKTKQNEVAAEQSEPKSNRKRGRPPGSTKNDVDEDRRIWEAWGTGQYRTYAALASEKNLDADEIECALDRHRKKIAKSRRKKSG